MHVEMRNIVFISANITRLLEEAQQREPVFHAAGTQRSPYRTDHL